MKAERPGAWKCGADGRSSHRQRGARSSDINMDDGARGQNPPMAGVDWTRWCSAEKGWVAASFACYYVPETIQGRGQKVRGGRFRPESQTPNDHTSECGSARHADPDSGLAGLPCREWCAGISALIYWPWHRQVPRKEGDGERARLWLAHVALVPWR